jgi:hypothetical protein
MTTEPFMINLKEFTFQICDRSFCWCGSPVILMSNTIQMDRPFNDPENKGLYICPRCDRISGLIGKSDGGDLRAGDPVTIQDKLENNQRPEWMNDLNAMYDRIEEVE